MSSPHRAAPSRARPRPAHRRSWRAHLGGSFGYGMHADIAVLLADKDMSRVTLMGHSFGEVVAAVLAGVSLARRPGGW